MPFFLMDERQDIVLVVDDIDQMSSWSPLLEWAIEKLTVHS